MGQTRMSPVWNIKCHPNNKILEALLAILYEAENFIFQTGETLGIILFYVVVCFGGLR